MPEEHAGLLGDRNDVKTQFQIMWSNQVFD